MKKIYLFASIYLILGLVFGVFYREFTLFHEYLGKTQLAVLHTHSLVMGTFFLFFVLIFNKLFKINEIKSYPTWFIIYNIGFIGFLNTLLIRGIGQVLSWELSGFNHIAGLFHAILGVSLVWFIVIFGKSLKREY